MKELQFLLDQILPNRYIVLDSWDEQEDFELIGIYQVMDYVKYQIYSPDVIICKDEIEEYYVVQYIQTHHGTYYEPPEGDYFDIKTGYKNLGSELFKDIILHLISQDIDNAILDYQMLQQEQNYEE